MDLLLPGMVQLRLGEDGPIGTRADQTAQLLPLDALPDDLLAAVFSHLTLRNRMAGPCRVCRRWRDLCYTPSLLDAVHVTVHRNQGDSQAVRRLGSLLFYLQRHAPHVRRLSLELQLPLDSSGWQRRHLIFLAHRCLAPCAAAGALHHLHIYLPGSPHLGPLFGSLTSLQSLHVASPIAGGVESLAALSHLQDLSLLRIAGLGSAGCRLPPGLTRLCLSMTASGSMAHRLPDFGLSALTGLRCLQLRGMPEARELPSGLCATLGQLPHLTQLSLTLVSFLLEETVLALGPQLRLLLLDQVEGAEGDASQEGQSSHSVNSASQSGGSSMPLLMGLCLLNAPTFLLHGQRSQGAASTSRSCRTSWLPSVLWLVVNFEAVSGVMLGEAWEARTPQLEHLFVSHVTSWRFALAWVALLPQNLPSLPALRTVKMQVPEPRDQRAVDTMRLALQRVKEQLRRARPWLEVDLVTGAAPLTQQLADMTADCEEE
ncbi:hypothetical protein D9Q98_009838 [Chlorella vulgaris]|uniref:F-box domain-containing protein n=1 Tax=Chlorella vulgaris TaxID=3077 RepID=A0A9D4YSQ6_CHLVU|nr:hypothetical protein D9Q98_009838 [Chlorella vulgaris]